MESERLTIQPPPPGEPWTEDRLSNLIPYEHEAQEFKGSGFIYVKATGQLRPDFLDNLSKQVSAFCNAGGGRLFLGIDDVGRVGVRAGGALHRWPLPLPCTALDLSPDGRQLVVGTEAGTAWLVDVSALE